MGEKDKFSQKNILINESLQCFIKKKPVTISSLKNFGNFRIILENKIFSFLL